MEKYSVKDFIFMYLLFPFTLAPMHSVQKGLYYTIVLFSLGILFCKSTKCKFSKINLSWLFCFLSCFIILFFLTLFLPICYGTNDGSYTTKFIDYIIKYIIICVCALMFSDIDQFFLAYSKATSLYVFFSLILLIPSIRMGYMSLLPVSDETNSHAQFLLAQGVLYYTRFGLQGFSGFEYTFRCSLAFIFLICMLPRIKAKKEKKFLYFLLFINFLGCCLYGRIGILSCMMSVFVYILYISIFEKDYRILFSIFVVIIFLIVTFLVLLDQIKENPTLAWMFEPFINLVETGKLSSSSSDGLKTMYIKISEDTLLTGDGYYQPNGKYYKGTDVGILRPLLFWGAGGSFIYYFCFLLLLIPIYNEIVYKETKVAKLLVLLLFMQNLLFEIKGEANLAFIHILMGMNSVLLFKNISRRKVFDIKKRLFIV